MQISQRYRPTAFCCDHTSVTYGEFVIKEPRRLIYDGHIRAGRVPFQHCLVGVRETRHLDFLHERVVLILRTSPEVPCSLLCAISHPQTGLHTISDANPLCKTLDYNAEYDLLHTKSIWLSILSFTTLTATSPPRCSAMAPTIAYKACASAWSCPEPYKFSA